VARLYDKIGKRHAFAYPALALEKINRMILVTTKRKKIKIAMAG